MSKLASFVNEALRSGMEGLFVALPGKVTSYDATTQRADVQPLIQRGYRGEDQKRAVKRLPVASDVPVMHIGSAEGRITTPVKKGTRVLLVCCSSSIARWKSVDDEVDPGDDRRHKLADAIAIVGLYGKAPTSAPADAVVIHAGNGITIKLGGPTGTQPTIMGTAYRSAEDTMLTVLQSLCTAIVGMTAPVGTYPHPAVTAAAAAAAAAIGTFQAAAASYLAQKTEVK